MGDRVRGSVLSVNDLRRMVHHDRVELDDGALLEVGLDFLHASVVQGRSLRQAGVMFVCHRRELFVGVA